MLLLASAAAATPAAPNGMCFGGGCSTGQYYSIGGSVSGLTGSGLVLRDNGTDNLPVSANGTFKFSVKIEIGSAYSVIVATQPTGETCTVTSGGGTATANVSNIAVACSASGPFTIGGTVSGLTGTGLTLYDNGGDGLAISGNGTFTFVTPITKGSSYSVTVGTQPTGQTCTVTSGSGTANATVSNVAVACTANGPFSIGGTVSGLTGTGLTLYDNGADGLAISGNGAFTFATQIAKGLTYSVTVGTEPTGQTCSVTSGGGTANATVSNVSVTCSAIGSGPAVPTLAMIILQGQNIQSQNNWGNAAGQNHTITQPTYQTIGWKSSSSGSPTTYKIYRCTAATPGTCSSFTYLAAVSASAAASNYSTYAGNTPTNSNGDINFAPVAPSIDSVWQDTTTGNGTVVSGTYGPTSGTYFGPVTGYAYTVTAVNGGGESAQSSPTILPIIANGVPVFIDTVFNNGTNITWRSANPGATTTPLGFANSAAITLGFFPSETPPHYVNPALGFAGVQWNIGISAFKYLVLNIYTAQTWASNTFQYGVEVADDISIDNPSVLSLSPSPTPGTWTTFKIPLSTWQTPQSGSGSDATTIGVEQQTMYKTTWSNNSGSNIVYSFEEYLSVN